MMFFVRLNKLRIVDNREKPLVLRFFGADRAEMKLISFIATDQTDLPEIDGFLATTDPHGQRAMLSAAVRRVVGSRVLTTIQNVTDNHEMTFGDTGYVLYQSERIPEHFDWILLAIESDQDVRDIGGNLADVVSERAFDNFLAHTFTLASTAANPSFAAAVGIGRFVTRILAQTYQKNRDDMLGLLYTSLNRREHYPYGERKKDDVPDLTNNMLVDYSVFGFERSVQPAPLQRLPPVTTGVQPRRAA